MQMTCPKCHGDMRVYERSGVTVDQCTECRGIFLDRGELEKLFEAEASWNGGAQPGGQPQPPRPQSAPAQGGYAPPPPPPGGGYPQQQPGYPPQQPGYPPQQPGYPPAAPGYPPAAPAYGQQHGYHGHYHNKKRKKSFLNELFD